MEVYVSIGCILITLQKKVLYVVQIKVKLNMNWGNKIWFSSLEPTKTPNLVANAVYINLADMKNMSKTQTWLPWRLKDEQVKKTSLGIT